MVGKLMKHEFLRTRGPLGLSAAIALLVCAVAYGLALISPVVATFPFGIALAISLVFTFGVQLYLAIEFYRSSFGRRGYFTHTLPVRGSTLVGTKLAYAMLVTLAAVLWTIVLLLICLATAVELRMITYDAFWSGLGDLFGTSRWFLWFLALNIVGLLISTIVQYYFSVAVGSEAWINKTGGMGPVVTFLIVYAAFQVVALVAFLLPPTFDPFTESWRWSMPLLDMIDDPEQMGIPLSVFWVSYVLSAVMIWRTVVSVGRKLELR
jgi:hypothetical protein